jgi:NADPH-dependent glutamate synthase beta subunit-like oxidoreductase/NAD-dependent dihydropyrimidine dehydrogenase PreA subunit
MAIKEKVLDLANKYSRVKRGSKDEIKPEYPEYRILEPVLTDEMAEVGLCLGFREPKTAAQIARECGKDPKRVAILLWDLAMAGAAFVNKDPEGVDRYWHELWVPGHMEMMVNHKENVRRFPQIAEAFDAYGKRRGPKTAGNFPVGTGMMRVIPIEKAIDGETRRASYEEVSRYLEEHDVFSVSDCSCRTSREAMGEGCGHPKEDMCIQLGHAAEYYIRTGRGRQITREQAYEIIRRAEANGLAHQIPNTDGPGKTHAICNCCGCSCFSFRIAGHFRNPDMLRSNYVSAVDPDKCVACGECVEACPTNALKLGRKLCGPVDRDGARELPGDTEWGPDKWNPEYRTNRKVTLDEGSSPCKAECPAHLAVQGYVKLASQGRYDEALALIKQENPFPAVCGRVCPRACESACTRGAIDESVAIDEIKKFIAERDLDPATRYVPPKRYDFGDKVAVVGGGPAGLSCAYFLAVDGYRVTVFERESRLGGMLTMGIPSFRLGKDVVDAEIEALASLGVEFRLGVEVGKDISIGSLRAEGYKAFYLAIGARGARRLGVDGEGAEGVISGVRFLGDVNSGRMERLYGEAVVIGGGNVAIDVARTAVRTGATGVSMYCLEDRARMPALPEEVAEASHEGVRIECGWGPRRILVEGGHVVGVEFRKCVSAFDASGRFSPTFDDSDVMSVKADHVLVSIGQAIEWGGLIDGLAVELRPNGTVVADPLTFQTGEPDVFAGGDAYAGPRFAIDAIAMGKEGAISIHRFVRKGHSLVMGRTRRAYTSFDKDGLDLSGYDAIPRQAAAKRVVAEPFEDDRATFTEDQVRAETERCLSCGATVVDEFMCVGCGVCASKCRFDAIKLERRYDAQAVEFKDLKRVVVAHMLKRKLKIAAKKLLSPFMARSGGRR